MTGPSPRPAAIVFIFILIVMDVLAMGIIIPVLPKLVERFLAGDTAQAAVVFGYFATAWALMQFFAMPVLGALSDRFGRRPVILISCLGLGLDYFVMALAPTLAWLFVGRLISGVTSASITTAFAYVADVTPGGRRVQAFGMLGVAFNLGFVLGPALGGALGAVDPRLPFWVAGAFALANAAYGWFVLPESLARDKRAPFRWQRANPFGAMKLLRSHRELLGLAAVFFLMQLAHASLPTTAVLYMGYRYGWDELAVGLVLAGVGVSGMIVQGGLMRPVVARIGERRALVVGLLMGATGFWIYGLASVGWAFLLGIPVAAFWGLAGPSAQSIMTRRVSESEQGLLQGAVAMMMSLASIVGPTLFTQIFATFIRPDAPAHLPGVAFLVAGLLLLVAMVIGWIATRPDRR